MLLSAALTVLPAAASWSQTLQEALAAAYANNPTLLAARAQARPARLFLGPGTGLPADLSALMKDASDSQLRGALAVTALAAFLLTSRR